MARVEVAKEGFDVNSATPKDFALNNDYMTMKVALSGTLEISLPAETIVAGGGIAEKTYTDTVAHGLNRLPMIMPHIGLMYLDYTDTSDVILNDYRQQVGGTLETAIVQITNTNLTLFISRRAVVVDRTFQAKKVTFYYTIFYNRFDEEFNAFE